MPNYKLTYFPIAGRAEVSRWIFAVAKQPYTDDRIKWEEWPALKATTPFGQLPLLTVDGVTISQSHVIDEFLARQFNLAGSTPVEHARAAMIGQCCEDALKPLFPLRTETDDGKKAEIVKKYTTEQVPQFLALFDNLLKSNGGGDGYFVGSKLTYADLAFVFFLGSPKENFGIDVSVDKFPKLAALKKRVESEPSLAEWIKKRPAPINPPK